MAHTHPEVVPGGMEVHAEFFREIIPRFHCWVRHKRENLRGLIKKDPNIHFLLDFQIKFC